MESERTAIHIYPAEEVAAMRAFYGGETCVVSRINIARWAHMLDAALSSSTPHRVFPSPSCIVYVTKEFASFNGCCNAIYARIVTQLTLQRYGKTSFRVSSLTNTILWSCAERHDREYSCIDLRRPRATLFLHEDLVARTLHFERDLKEWRLAEIQVGRGDPGRQIRKCILDSTYLVSRNQPVFQSKHDRLQACLHQRLTVGMQAHIIRPLFV